MNHIVLSSQNKTTIDSLRKELETELDDDMESIITDGRYTYIQKLISTTVEKPKEKLTMSDKIDKIVTNRFLGILSCYVCCLLYFSNNYRYICY
jgi:ferrous iron transport protein B